MSIAVQLFIRCNRPLSIQIVKISTAVTTSKYNTKIYQNMHKGHEYTSCGHKIYNGHSNTDHNLRKYSHEIENVTVDYDYVKNSIEKQDTLIVDVREPDEIKEHGKIPNSINIPLGNITDVFDQMSVKDFQRSYQKIKPSKDTEIIFYCMIGKRSGRAQQTARNLGFKNAKNYLGSWNDWAVNTQKK